MRPLTFAMAVFGVIVLGQMIPAVAQETLQPGENLVVEGVPPIPLSLVDDVTRYTESRSAGFVDWHPTRRQMLIKTRFSNTSQIHLVEMPGGARQQLTFAREPIGAAEFAPIDGNGMLFGKDTGGNEFWQMYWLDLKTRRTELLTDGGRTQNGGWIWSHARDRIAYTSTRRNGRDRDIWTMVPTQPGTDRLLTELPGGGWSIADWSPDDSTLLIREYISINHSRLYLVDLKNAERQLITPVKEEIAYGHAEFGSDRNMIYTTSNRDAEFMRLCRLDVRSGEQTALTPDQWDVESFSISPDGMRMAYTVNAAGVSELFMRNLETQKTERVDAWPLGVIDIGDWRDNGEEFSVTVSTPQQTADVYSVDRDLKVTRWTFSETGGLNPEQLAKAELIKWKSFDDLELSGFLYRPPQASGKTPVIIKIHGGPESQVRPIFQGRNNYFINEMGVTIITPNVRGSNGYGKTFVKLDNGLKREDSVRDIGALLDWIAEQSGLDDDKVMITGGSYGGYMTLASAVHFNDRIACSLDVVGISHFGTFLKNTENYRRDLRRAEYGDERDPELAAFFEKIAPLNQTEKITKPIFIVQGGNDPRVPLSESEQMVSKLRQGSHPVWYLMATDEGHGFRKKPNADFEFYSTVLFVRRFLLGSEATGQ